LLKEKIVNQDNEHSESLNEKQGNRTKTWTQYKTAIFHHFSSSKGYSFL